MKKIVGILGMAAVLASAAFADAPAANFVMAEFDGSAKLDFQADLDKEAFGMVNEASGSMKFGFVTAGDKTTTGDGVWGELHIKSDAKDWGTYGGFDMAAAMKAGEEASAAWVKANPIEEFKKTWTLDATKSEEENLKALNEAYEAAAYAEAQKAMNEKINATGAGFNLPAVAVDVAKIHFINGDFYTALNILTPSLKYGAFATVAATPYGVADMYKASEIGSDADLKAGFALNLGLTDMFDANIKFMDNGVAKDKKFGLAFDASLKAVDNLNAMIMGTFNFGNKVSAFAATTDYKFGITEKMYVKPSLAFAMSKTGDAKAVNSLAAGLLFGWGASDCDPDLDYLDDKDAVAGKKADELKTNEGVSITFLSDLDKANKMVIGLYDQSVLSLLGDDFGTLKTGVQFNMPLAENSAKELIAAAKYNVSVSVIDINAHFGIKANLVKDNNTTDYKYGFGVSTAKVIDNTDLYANYEGGKDKKGTITVGTKIHF